VTEFVSLYGIWVVAAFIALESVGLPLPAEAALIAAAFFAARTQGINIWYLIAAGIFAAVLGEIVGFWLGRRFGRQLLNKYGTRLGFTEGRIRIGQWLFVRYGGRFVFMARFLPFLRNMSAVLAGTNAMAQGNFYFASATAAAAWIVCYGLAAYWFGEAFATFASPVTMSLGLAAAMIVVAVPTLILRYEKHLLAKAESGLPGAPSRPSACRADRSSGVPELRARLASRAAAQFHRPAHRSAREQSHHQATRQHPGHAPAIMARCERRLHRHNLIAHERVEPV
jgi:membrane protein DedA with SNARE-associated domain